MGAPSNRGRRVARAVLVVVFALGAVGVTGSTGGAATVPEPDLSASVVGGKPIAFGDFPALAAIMLAGPARSRRGTGCCAPAPSSPVAGS